MRQDNNIYIRFLGLSLRLNSRVFLLSIILIFITICMSIYILSVGDIKLSLSEISETFLGKGSKKSSFVIFRLRLPRIIAAILVGFSLSVSGLFFQKVLNNSLASPDIIGVNTGASVGAVFIIMNNLPKHLIPFVSFTGAILTTLLVYFLSYKRKLLPIRLILIGIAINSMLSALISIMLVRGRINDISAVYRWLTGSLYSVTWPEIFLLISGILIITPILGVNLYKLRLLQLGDSASRATGLKVEKLRFIYLICASILSSLAVSISGPIGFIALVVPHITSFFYSKLTFGTIILTGLIGALIVLFADYLTLNFLPKGLPVGTVIAGVAAPYFLFLLYRLRGMN